MLDFGYCGGNPCREAQLLVSTDQIITEQLDRVSDAAFDVLDSLSAVSGDIPELNQFTDESLKVNQRAHDALMESRENSRRILTRYCIQCPGTSEGVCPTFPVMGELNK